MTTRNFDLVHANAVVKDTVRGALLARLVFDSGVLAVNNTDRDIKWKGETYAGIGTLGHVGATEEVTTVEASTLQLTLTGINPDYISIALNENYINHDVELYLILFDEQYDMLASPLLMFKGIMDSMSIQIGEEMATVTVDTTSRLKDWERLRLSRYNGYDQKRKYYHDLSLDMVEEVTEKEVPWGEF